MYTVYRVLYRGSRFFNGPMATLFLNIVEPYPLSFIGTWTCWQLISRTYCCRGRFRWGSQGCHLEVGLMWLVIGFPWVPMGSHPKLDPWDPNSGLWGCWMPCAASDLASGGQSLWPLLTSLTWRFALGFLGSGSRTPIQHILGVVLGSLHQAGIWQLLVMAFEVRLTFIIRPRTSCRLPNQTTP